MNRPANQMQAVFPERSVRAFTLVEVVLALGIASFCLIVLLGLLPMGLMTAKNTREQTAAASLVEAISTGIRNASTNSSGIYAASGICTNLTWQLVSQGGSSVSASSYFSLGGVSNTTASESQLIAEIEVFPPANAISSGTAFISVAWPQQAQWSSSTTSWSNAAGAVDSWITFIPKQ